MRIVAGSLKGRRLEGPTWEGLRPTSDRLRETLFDILGPSVAGLRVLDAFAGTGALGLEAVSRGASHATFVERDRQALALLARNIAQCGVEQVCTVVREDWRRPRAPTGRDRPGVAEEFDLILLDPPYDSTDVADALVIAGARLSRGGRVVLEHGRRQPPPDAAGGLRRVRTVTAGDSALSFYAPEAS